MIALITSIVGLVAAVIGFPLLFHKVQQVHVLVNSNLTEVMRLLAVSQDRSLQLKDTLKDAGVPVPERKAENHE